jgi:hypothetical protein
MSTPLPSRPSLEHLRNEARDLMKAHTSGDVSCCGTLRGLRRFKDAPDARILKEEVAYQEVQLALATKYGFRDWAALRAAVAAAGADPGERPDAAVTPSAEDGAERAALLERLVARGPASAWTLRELIEFFKAATALARYGGLVALLPVPERLDDPFLKLGMRLAIDGTDGEIVRGILEQRKRTLLADYERRLDLIVAGVNGVVWGENPAVLETRGRAFLPGEGGRAAA